MLDQPQLTIYSTSKGAFVQSETCCACRYCLAAHQPLISLLLPQGTLLSTQASVLILAVCFYTVQMTFMELQCGCLHTQVSNGQ